MLVSMSLQRFFSPPPPLFQIFTFRAVLTFYSSFLSCCFITFKGSLFRHEGTHVAFARIRDVVFTPLLFIFIPSSSPRFRLSAAFLFFPPFFFFSNIRVIFVRSFFLLSIEMVDTRTRVPCKCAECFTGTLINNASSTEIVVLERGRGLNDLKFQSRD